jgi:hypothetical protein
VKEAEKAKKDKNFIRGAVKLASLCHNRITASGLAA